MRSPRTVILGAAVIIRPRYRANTGLFMTLLLHRVVPGRGVAIEGQ